MIGTRILLGLALGSTLLVPAHGLAQNGGLFNRKARLEPARVRQLVEIVRSDPDEKKRKGGIADLAEADPRVQVEVMPAIVSALRKDSSVMVRAAAAEVIGRFKVVFPLAGVALEDALESDSSAEVRGAARQSLWEYHLLGYRSARGADGVAGQTVEPPIAKPARPGEAIVSEPAAIAHVAGTTSTPTISPLPPVGPPPGPRVATAVPRPGSALAVVPSHANLTVEPPIAKRGADAASLPAATGEPPIRARLPEPVRIGPPPRLALHLPPIVPPPGPLPGVTPFPEPTAEPPIAKATTPPGR